MICTGSPRLVVAAAMAVAAVLLSPLVLASTDAERRQAREEVEAIVEKNHDLRSRYVMASARFAKANRGNPLVYDVGVAEDMYEGALGTQSSVVGALGIVADSAFERDRLAMLNLDALPRNLKDAQAFEEGVAAKYSAVRDTPLSKSDRACYERQLEAARLARQVHEETLLLATRYVVVFGGSTPEEYAERKRRIVEAERAYFEQQAERRKITDESAAFLLIVLSALAQAAASP